jgi:ABC-type uncharacterized transport system substrate-binding protein
MTSYTTHKWPFNCLLLLILSANIMFISSPVIAATASIYLAHSGLQDSERNLVTQLVEKLQKTKPPGHTIKQLNTSKLTIAQIEQAITTPKSCVISIGDYSLEKVLAARQKVPIFSIMVERHKLDNYIANYARFEIPISGIYQEQSFLKQLMLAKAIKPKLKSVGVLLGTKTRYGLTNYQQTVNLVNLNLAFNLLKHNVSVQNYFERLPIENGFLMILNDQEHYSTNDLQSLMLTSNRRKIPMIGAKSSDTVFAALASVYTPVSELARQTALEVGKICSGQPMPNASYGSNYIVNINPHIANFLGYTDLTEEQLLVSIKSQEDALKNE